MDQLERKKGLTTERISAVREALRGADRAPAGQRGTILNTLSTQLEADARNSCDAPKVQMLRKAVMDLQNAVVS